MNRIFWAFLLLLNATNSSPQSSPWPNSDVFELAEPSHRVPFRPQIDDNNYLLPIELVGLDFVEQGPEGRENFRDVQNIGQLLFQEGLPMVTTCYWRSTGAPGPFVLHLEVQGFGPAFTGDYPVETTNWQPGALHSTQHKIELHRMRYNGPARMTFSISTKEHGEKSIVWTQPIHITPSTRLLDSDIDFEKLRAFFGAISGRLGVMFRLGPKNQLLVPAIGVKEPIAGVGIVSATSYDNALPQGAPICHLEFLDASGQVLESTTINLGITTAKSDYMEYPAGYVHSRPIRVFSERKAERVSRFGLGEWKMQLYGSTVSFDRPITPDSVRATYQANEGLFELREVVFLSKVAP